MLAALPAPVLSVTADAVRDLDGQDALSGLWTLFTKCKESIQDGRRLENISWRLWYREMMAMSIERDECLFDEKSENGHIDGNTENDNVYRPPTPDDATQQVPFQHATSGPTLLMPDHLPPSLFQSPSFRPVPPRRLSSASSRKAKSAGVGVGKIICDLLPQSLPPPELLRRRTLTSLYTGFAQPSQLASMPCADTHPPRCDLPMSDDAATAGSLPTPATEGVEPRPLPYVPASDESLQQEQTSMPSLELTSRQQALDPSASGVPALTVIDASSPSISLISGSDTTHTSPVSSMREGPSASRLTLPPPRLIVVKPTPNPTPHPTPPATPVLLSATLQPIATPGLQIQASSGNHLLPPHLYHVMPVISSASAGPGMDQGRAIQIDIDPLATALDASRENPEMPAVMSDTPRIPHDDVRVPPSPALTEDNVTCADMETQNMEQPCQLHHDILDRSLGAQVKVADQTPKPSGFLRMMPSSPSTISHIFGETLAVTSKSGHERSMSKSSSVSSPGDDAGRGSLPNTSPSGKSEQKNGSPRPGAELVRRGSGRGTRPSKKVLRENSAGNVVTISSAGAATAQNRSKSQSRSRSRDGRGGSGPAGAGLGLGAGGLVMTRAASNNSAVRTKHGGKVVGGSRVCVRLGARKAVDRERERSKEKKEKEEDQDKDGLKHPTFNIGSNSDEGSGVGSKSTGSGSEISGGVVPEAKIDEHRKKSKLGEGLKREKKEKELVEKVKAVDQQRIAKVQEVLEEKMILGAQAMLEALLPQQQRRIVLATSESDEYETETDEGSWSSEEMSADEAEPVKSGGSGVPPVKEQQQSRPRPQPQPQQPHVSANNARVVDDAVRYRQLPTNPQPPQNDKQSQASRNIRRQQIINQARAHAQSIEQAALEAQRQREMFAKIPTLQNLREGVRTRSVGLLTQLMNPDPQIFPPNHPYRRGFSSGEIRGGQGQGKTRPRPPAGLAMTGMARPASPKQQKMQQQEQPLPQQRQGQGVSETTLAPPVAAPAEVRRQISAPQQQQYGVVPGLMLAPGLKPSKSAAAVPVASQVLVASLPPNGGSENGVLESRASVKPGMVPRIPESGERPPGGYRPRGRPEDEELEDESGSEEEEGLQVSKSVAQEKLRALAERRGIRPNRRASADYAHENANEIPVWAQEPEQQPSQQQHKQWQQQRMPIPMPAVPIRTHSTPAPVPQALAHPYNLPLAALPTTPRTTRRHMLQTEMSESLRRNLLWERQVSKNTIVGFRRAASSSGAKGNGLRTNDPVPALPNVVRLSAKGSTSNGNAANGTGQAGEAQIDKEEMRRRAVARNRSWAVDYHYAGW
ncbi:hypothetical protein AX17_007134 [Amanita inopinata Kibby_2008]|nr:hypothetical protein AX17_007134 [Amanita inopinata Kibby_2008]